MAFFAKLTAVGLAALAAAQVGDPVVLGEMRLGDAGGVAYEPDGSETALVNEVTASDVESVVVDPANAQQLLITAVFPLDPGGFTVREVGVFTAAGDLFAVANLPDLEKPDPDDGAGVEMVIILTVAFSGDPEVTVLVDPSVALATREWVWANRDFFALVSATTATPPGAPAEGDAYLIPAGPTDAWAGQAGKIAIWRGAVAASWLFVTPRLGATAVAADEPLTWRKGVAGWDIHNPGVLHAFDICI